MRDASRMYQTLLRLLNCVFILIETVLILQDCIKTPEGVLDSLDCVKMFQDSLITLRTENTIQLLLTKIRLYRITLGLFRTFSYSVKTCFIRL